MKVPSLILLLPLVLLQCDAPLAGAADKEARPTASQMLEPASARELAAGVASGMRIRLGPGDFDLSSLPSSNPLLVADKEHALHLAGATDLHIAGAGSGKTRLLCDGKRTVIRLTNCENITMRGMSVGHFEGENCVFGCLVIKWSEELLFEDCDFFGSGAFGVRITGSRKITFKNCRFRDTSDRELLAVIGCSDVTFDQCEFTRASVYFKNYVVRVEASEGTLFKRCSFTMNSVRQREFDEAEYSLVKYEKPVLFMTPADSDYGGPVVIEDCRIENNIEGSFGHPEPAGGRKPLQVGVNGGLEFPELRDE